MLKTVKKSKRKAKTTYNQKLEKKSVYVADTSVLVDGRVSRLVKKWLSGKIIIPDAVIAELEHLANLGKEAGFLGLDELARLHKLKAKHKLKIVFLGPRPAAGQIKYARFGEVDAIVRELAFKNKAVLITSDIVQAKSAGAYNVKVYFVKPKVKIIKKKPKRNFFSFFKKKVFKS